MVQLSYPKELTPDSSDRKKLLNPKIMRVFTVFVISFCSISFHSISFHPVFLFFIAQGTYSKPWVIWRPSLFSRLATPTVLQPYCWLLKYYKENKETTNHAIIKMLHRVAADLKTPAMLFQLSLFCTFQKILSDPAANQYKVCHPCLSQAQNLNYPWWLWHISFKFMLWEFDGTSRLYLLMQELIVNK